MCHLASGASGESLSLANESQYLIIHRPSVRSLLREINSRGLEELTEVRLNRVQSVPRLIHWLTPTSVTQVVTPQVIEAVTPQWMTRGAITPKHGWVGPQNDRRGSDHQMNNRRVNKDASVHHRLTMVLLQDELVQRFRGNLVMDGGEAYEEDSWDTLMINGTTLQVRQPSRVSKGCNCFYSLIHTWLDGVDLQECCERLEKKINKWSYCTYI